MASVAINVAANTNEPGFRGPLFPDGSFEYVPIPESEPTAEPVVTYADFDLETDVDAVADRPVHFDPQFPEVSLSSRPGPDRYLYGDEHGVKARPLSELAVGDHVFFYATLTTAEREGDRSHAARSHPDWVPPEWGAYLIGHFELARDPVTGVEYRELPPDERAVFDANAHVKRAEFDARVLLLGDPDGSALYETAVPLSSPSGGADPNRLVTELSADSGKGPWWRRPLRFDDAATADLLALADETPAGDPVYRRSGD